MPDEIAVKVGGSLFDLPDLGNRLRRWLETLPASRALFVAGGGGAADLVREADALDHLGEEDSHWLALRALEFTAHVLAARLPGGVVIDNIADRQAAWDRGQIPILNLHSFARADEAQPDHLPHRWDITSDSLAARVAAVAGMFKLVLLKSNDLPDGSDWAEAARGGIVDAAFANVLKCGGPRLRVTVVNFRRWAAADASVSAPQDPAL